jgi:hypothetical protein
MIRDGQLVGRSEDKTSANRYEDKVSNEWCGNRLKNSGNNEIQHEYTE